MNDTPYYSPSYFPTSYNDATSTTPITPTSLTPYFSTSYFPLSYFCGISTGSIPITPVPVTPYPIIVPIPAPTGRDAPAYVALMAEIKATGAFEAVLFGGPNRRGQVGAGTYPIAIVTPKGWDEADEADPILIVRRVLFGLRIVVRSDGGDPPFAQFDQLCAEVQAVVDRSDLSRTCVPALTKIRAGRYDYAAHYPEQCLDLDGEFSTIYDPAAASSVTATTEED